MQTSGAVTYAEILQQPDLWPTTLERVRKSGFAGWCAYRNPGQAAILTGAGTSAYAAASVAAAWPDSRAIPSTDLLVCSREELDRLSPQFAAGGLLVSFARSGDSPESIAVVERMRKLFPNIRNLAITCNEKGRLANTEGIERIVLDPRTNDRSLVMTSSFSNLVLAGLAVEHGAELDAELQGIVENVRKHWSEMDATAQRLAEGDVSRVVVLASGALAPLASEACLKILEITAGRTFTMAETFLGLRHGPMSFLRDDAIELAFLSNDEQKRRYELDLLREVKQKGLGRVVVVGPAGIPGELFDVLVPASAPEAADYLRVPFEIVFAQLFAYYLSLEAGLNPDNPSPGGVITRVVQGFEIHG